MNHNNCCSCKNDIKCDGNIKYLYCWLCRGVICPSCHDKHIGHNTSGYSRQPPIIDENSVLGIRQSHFDMGPDSLRCNLCEEIQSIYNSYYNVEGKNIDLCEKCVKNVKGFKLIHYTGLSIVPIEPLRKKIKYDDSCCGNRSKKFNIDMITKFIKADKNAIVCPYGIQSIISALILGTKDNAQNELKVISDGTQISKDNNFVFARSKGCKPVKEITDSIQAYFGVDTKFANDIIEKKMGNDFKNLLGDIGVMTFVNFCILECSWKTKFPKTMDMPFNEMKEKMEMMVDTRNVKYLNKKNEFKVVSVPTKDVNKEMIFMMPDKGKSVNDLASNIYKYLDEFKNNYKIGEAQIIIPKIKISTGITLFNDVFKENGVTEIFGGPDLSKMGAPNGSYVEEIGQKATGIIDENGATMKAVSFAKVNECVHRPPPTFKFDMPHIVVALENGIIKFVFIILHGEVWKW